LLLGSLTLILGVYGINLCYQILWKKGDKAEPLLTEKKYYLLSMIAIILLVSRIINVFYFYYVLVSLIPVIPGAMCPYGVLNVSIPGIGFIDLIIKIIVPFCYLTWLILDHINKSTKRLTLTPKLALSYVFIMFPLLIIDAVLDWIYFWFMEPIAINCCRDVYNEATNYNPLEILGPETAFIVFLTSVLLLIAIVFIQYFLKSNPQYLIYSLICVIITIPLFIITLQEFIAPMWIFASKKLLNQPLGAAHHCPFCLLKRWWTMALFIILIWIGFASVGWQYIVKKNTRYSDESIEIATPLIEKLRLTSVLSIISGILLLVAHLLFFILFNLI
jgi:hypothetical protein